MSLVYKLISIWFLITAPFVLWDATYCFMRPHSMKGGKLHWIWKPYGLYQEIDYIYGVPAYKNHNGFTNAQALVSVIETVLGLQFVTTKSPGAPVLGFASTTMTLSKTILAWAQEYYCDWCNVGHNGLFTLVVFWVLPNCLWTLFPALIALKLGSDISGNLNAHAKKRSDVKTG